ncbi:MAG: hypothetical protein JNM95_09950 [Chitinophagaceae bacterium]|nr:hypothetical protein [Chitinophagaceae bacterium]
MKTNSIGCWSLILFISVIVKFLGGIEGKEKVKEKGKEGGLRKMVAENEIKKVKEKGKEKECF